MTIQTGRGFLRLTEPLRRPYRRYFPVAVALFVSSTALLQLPSVAGIANSSASAATFTFTWPTTYTLPTTFGWVRSQTITFTSSPPSSATVGGTYTQTATGGGSGNPVTFSIDTSSTSGACSISGAKVSFTGTGTCVIDANQAGNRTYAAASQVRQTITVAAAKSSSTAMGAYAGSMNPAWVANFASETGANVTIASSYIPGGSGWSGLDGAGGSLNWLTGAWAGTGYQLVLGVPLIPTDASGSPQGTLAQGATGAYNSYFQTLAQTLVSAGFGSTYLRLGWEFNGNWFAWKVTNSTDAANFAAYWRNIVTSMRSVPGASFKFVWNPNISGSYGSAYTASQAYPGNAYVDFIGVDIYDTTTWSNNLVASSGLNWLASFAAGQGKLTCFPEWGLANVDDPAFINNMAAWFSSNKVAWASYFNVNYNGQDSKITDGTFAKALAAFTAAFG